MTKRAAATYKDIWRGEQQSFCGSQQIHGASPDPLRRKRRGERRRRLFQKIFFQRWHRYLSILDRSLSELNDGFEVRSLAKPTGST